MVVTTTRIVSVNSQAPPAVQAEAFPAHSTAALPAAWSETYNEPVKVTQLLFLFFFFSDFLLEFAAEAMRQ